MVVADGGGGIIRRSTVGAFGGSGTMVDVGTKISLTAGLGKKMWKPHTMLPLATTTGRNFFGFLLAKKNSWIEVAGRQHGGPRRQFGENSSRSESIQHVGDAKWFLCALRHGCGDGLAAEASSV